MVATGTGYLIDCRMHGGPGAENIDRCWLTALPIMGIGTAGAGAFRAGYLTPNPDITPKQRRQAAQTEKVE
jgi:hypothetical protein